MFIVFPIDSDHERERMPAATLALIGINAVVFGICAASGPDGAKAVYESGGYAPASPWPYTLITHLFLHGGILHLFGNMVFLWAFGPDLEDDLGRFRFLGLYFMFGLAAVLGHDLFVRIFQPAMLDEKVIGASGAISGLIGFHVIRFWRFRLRLYYLIFLIFYLRQGFGWVPSVLFVGLWILVQFTATITSTLAEQGVIEVAYWAHAAGFLAGLGLALATRQIRRGTAERWLALGRERFRAGRWWQALEAFQKLEKADPAAAAPVAEQARCWEVIGRRDRARERFAEAVRRLVDRRDTTGACDLYLEYVTAFPDATAPVGDEKALRALVAECERRGKETKAAPLYEALMGRDG
jgi:membrane associated rhomboid family serine protease